MNKAYQSNGRHSCSAHTPKYLICVRVFCFREIRKWGGSVCYRGSKSVLCLNFSQPGSLGLGFLGSDDMSLGVWSATFRRNVLYLYSSVKQFEKTRQFEG